MTVDLLIAQADIKARRQPVTHDGSGRDKSGRFTLSDKTLRLRAAAERMKSCLTRDVEAMDRAKNRIRVDAYYRDLPHVGKLAVVETVSVEPTLFDRAA